MFRIRVRAFGGPRTVATDYRVAQPEIKRLHQRAKVFPAIKGGGAENRRQKRPKIAIPPPCFRPKKALWGSFLAFLPFFNISIKLQSNLEEQTRFVSSGSPNLPHPRHPREQATKYHAACPCPYTSPLRDITPCLEEKKFHHLVGGLAWHSLSGSDASFPSSFRCPA